MVNNSTQAFLKDQVYVVGEFYDKSQRLIGAERAYPELPLSPNGGASPFKMVFIIPLAKQSQELVHVVLTFFFLCKVLAIIAQVASRRSTNGVLSLCSAYPIYRLT